MDDHTTTTPLSGTGALDALSRISTVYTDLDGTLFAPGGRLLSDFSGRPSTAIAEALVALKRAGVSIVVVTGRSRIQGNEFIRILDVQAFIGEMGCTKQERGASALDISYDTGSFFWDRERYATPYDAIGGSGAVSELLEAYAGKLEYNTPRCLNRDVTHALRGNVDVEEVESFLHERGYELDLEDNGMMTAPLGSALDDPASAHGYHIVPAGTSKGVAVRKDIEQRGLSIEETLSIGDGPGDIGMGLETGVFVALENGLRNDRYAAGLDRLPRPAVLPEGLGCDGWVQMAKALLAAKGVREQVARLR